MNWNAHKPLHCFPAIITHDLDVKTIINLCIPLPQVQKQLLLDINILNKAFMHCVQYNCES